MVPEHSGCPSLLAEGGLGFLQLGVDQLPQVPDGLDGTKTDERHQLRQSLSVLSLGRFFDTKLSSSQYSTIIIVLLID